MGPPTPESQDYSYQEAILVRLVALDAEIRRLHAEMAHGTALRKGLPDGLEAFVHHRDAARADDDTTGEKGS